MRIYQSSNFKIYKAHTKRCNCFLIDHDDKLVLWDTSMGFEIDKIYQEIEKTKLQKLCAIFISHSHSDHVGNAQELSTHFKCPVYVHAKGVNHLKNGYCPVPQGITCVSKIIYKLSQKLSSIYDFSKIKPCTNVHELTDEILKSYLGEKSQLIEVLRHTNDSLALVLENKLCLVGDGFVNMLGIFRPPFADYPNELKTTWQKLLSLECDEYYPSHGKKMSLEELSSKITHM